MRSILVVLLLLPFSTFSSEIYLVKSNSSEPSQSFLLKINEGRANLSGLLENSLLGLSITKKSKSYRFDEAFLDSFAKTNGFLEIPESMKEFYQFPAYEVNVETKVLNSDTDGEKEVELTTSMLGTVGDAVKYILTKTNLKIDFFTGDIVESDRRNIESVTPEQKELSSGVFQILTTFDVDSLGASSSTHGTGFFISKEGHALTNLHVLEVNDGCIKNKECELDLVFQGVVNETKTVNAKVLTCSKIDDVCLIKLNLEEVTFFDMQLDSIPEKLYTLGYPGDKSRINADMSEERELTYSFGSPIGLSGRAISSSLFISGGASGSPFLSVDTNRVVGIVSNGAETFAQDHDGAPGIFRPLYLIEKDFLLSSYLSGSISLKVKEVVKEIEFSKTSAQVIKALKSYLDLKTYVGYNQIVEAAYENENKVVRRELVKFLLSDFEYSF